MRKFRSRSAWIVGPGLWALAVVAVPALAAAAEPPAAVSASSAHDDSVAALRDLRAAELVTWPPQPAGTNLDDQIAALDQRIKADPQNVGLYGALGALCAAKRDWAGAREAYIAAIQGSRQDAGYHRGLGLAAAELGLAGMAANELEVSQHLDPQGAQDTWRIEGAVWLLAGKRDKARLAYETGLMRLAPDSGPERLRLANDLLPLVQDKDGPVAARLLLERILPEARKLLATGAQAADSTQTAPANALVSNLLGLYIGEANSRAGTGSLREAGDLYAKAFGLAPQRDDLLVFAVDAYLAAGDAQKARTLQAGASAASPEASGVWLAGGRIAEAESRGPDAIAAYEKALALKPDQADVQLRLGSLYQKAGDSAKARKHLDALMADPKAPATVLYAYGLALIRDQKFDQAIAPLKRAVTADSLMATAWAALGACLQAGGKYPEAIDPLRKALELEKSPGTLSALALSYVRTGQVDQAIATYHDLLATAPDYKGARYNLGRTLYDAQRYQDAVPVLEEALKLEPDSYQVTFLLGACEYQAGDYQKAADTYTAALAQKRTPDGLQNLGLALEKLGRKDEAQKCYKEAQDMRATAQ